MWNIEKYVLLYYYSFFNCCHYRDIPYILLSWIKPTKWGLSACIQILACLNTVSCMLGHMSAVYYLVFVSSVRTVMSDWKDRQYYQWIKNRLTKGNDTEHRSRSSFQTDEIVKQVNQKSSATDWLVPTDQQKKAKNCWHCFVWRTVDLPPISKVSAISVPQSKKGEYHFLWWKWCHSGCFHWMWVNN